MKKKTTRIILASLLAMAFLAGAGMMIRQQIQYRKAIADGEEAARLAGLETTAPPVPSAKPTETPVPAAPEETEEPPEPLPEEALELAELDLPALRAVNEDVAGWISIPGTILSYPLVQGADNQYYLTRNWKKEYADSGSIFLESTASRDMSDFHTLVYGHRMRNESMFGSIKYYNSLDYWREHPSVYVVLDEAIYRYDIFTAEEAPVRGIVYRLDLGEKHLEEKFLQHCMEQSVIDTGLTPEAGDRFLTLSTCTGTGYYTTRWVVHAVLAQEYDRTTTDM